MTTSATLPLSLTLAARRLGLDIPSVHFAWNCLSLHAQSDAAAGVKERAVFAGMTAEERAAFGSKETAELMQTQAEDGLTFANKTSEWIAYERFLESSRPDRLFNDPLAQHLAGNYGQRLSDCFSLHAHYLFPEVGSEGFALYHASRTKLISTKLGEWTQSVKTGDKKQVVNLGAGLDTRAYWDREGLNGADLYVEVDDKKVNDIKRSTLEQLKTRGLVPDPMCDRKVISLDFSKESTKDLPKHGFVVSSGAPTCWLLEGLIMYLDEDAVRTLYTDISDLSVPGSYLILNFMNTPKHMPGKKHHASDFADTTLLSRGWTKTEQLMFGDTSFDFGRYPKGKPANKMLGFSFYKKTK